jgi:hypothetical protein
MFHAEIVIGSQGFNPNRCGIGILIVQKMGAD